MSLLMPKCKDGSVVIRFFFLIILLLLSIVSTIFTVEHYLYAIVQNVLSVRLFFFIEMI